MKKYNVKQNSIKPITPESAVSLSGLFYKRVKATPDKIADHYHDHLSEAWKNLSWSEAYREVEKWQTILRSFDIKAQDKIAILLKNCPEWVFSEQASLSIGAVIVPLYTNDRPENITYILDNADIKILIIENNQQIELLKPIRSQLQQLTAIISLDPSISSSPEKGNANSPVEQANLPLYYYRDRITEKPHVYFQYHSDPDDLATIVYTSGTTGKPKGVMLSHRNILFDTWASISAVPCKSDDKFLSFLPLSHMFERTAGYYIPMMSGAEIAYARSIDLLAADLQVVKPTVLVTVPRIFERVQQKVMAQLRQKPLIVQKLFMLTVDIGWKHFLY
ncbi:MAG: AMP-binding protein, partial [Thiotrichaceae bacterium]|nr:AMP-binding protein [Thiotrichaceae bacterium]